MEYQRVDSLTLAKKIVLLRVDWNVPAYKDKYDDFRIKQTRITIDYLLSQGAQIVIITHWGRPKGYDIRFSTERLVSFLVQYGYVIGFAPRISDAHSMLNEGIYSICVLENLRFLPHERSLSYFFAKKLALLADCYVQDAFGILSEATTTTCIVPYLFSQRDRAIGFVIAKEIAILNAYKTQAYNKKTVFILGGLKVPEKLTALSSAIPYAQTILLLPPLVNTVYAALNTIIGNTKVYPELYALARSIKQIIDKEHKNLLMPVDFQVQTGRDMKIVFKLINDIAPDDTVLGIGPGSVILMLPYLKNAKMILITGLTGFVGTSESWYTALSLIKPLVHKCCIIIAGGDSIQLAHAIFPNNNFIFLTGGSAAFAYLGKTGLIGLDPFKKEDIIVKS